MTYGAAKASVAAATSEPHTVGFDPAITIHLSPDQLWAPQGLAFVAVAISLGYLRLEAPRFCPSEGVLVPHNCLCRNQLVLPLRHGIDHAHTSLEDRKGGILLFASKLLHRFERIRDRGKRILSHGCFIFRNCVKQGLFTAMRLQQL